MLAGPDDQVPARLPPTSEVPVPDAARGWKETVETWLREGVYACEASKEEYRCWMGRVPGYLGALGFQHPPTSPRDFRREHIDALKYRAIGLRGSQLAPKTRAVLLSKLRDLLGFYGRAHHSASLLELASDTRLWRFRSVDPIRPTRGLREPADVDRLLASCDAETQVAVVLGAWSGLRSAEIRSVEVRDLELSLTDRSWLVVRSGKGGRPRRAPVPPAGRNVLLRAASGLGPTAHVYPRTYGVLRSRVLAASARAGLGCVRPHQLRASFILFALRAGVPEAVVQTWVGHSNPATTRAYVGRDPLIEDRAAQAFGAYLAGF